MQKAGRRQRGAYRRKLINLRKRARVIRKQILTKGGKAVFKKRGRSYKRVVKRVRRRRVTRRCNRRIRYLKKALKNKVVPATPAQQKILKKRIIKLRVIKGVAKYIKYCRHKIIKYRRDIKRKPSPKKVAKITKW